MASPFAAPLIDAGTLASYLRLTFTQEQSAQADLILRVVSEWARTIGGKRWNATDLLAPPDVIGVVLSASRREWNNPDRVITDNLGPLAVTYAKPPDQFFSRGELQILWRKSKGSLFTVSFRREENGWSTGYLYMGQNVSGDPFPYLNFGDPGWEMTLHPG